MGSLRFPKLQGVFPAIITPFDEHENLDEKSLRQLIDHFLRCGVHGIVCCGSTGEAGSLSKEERRHVIELTVKQVNGRGLVIAGTGTSSTRSTVELTRDAKAAGADAALVITPYGQIPTEEGLYLHYKTLTYEVDFPLIVYNVPQATMVNVSTSLLKRMVDEIESLVAVKESSGNISQVADDIRQVGAKISVLTGNDAGLYPDFMLGCAGAIIAIGNVAPELAVGIFSSVQKGDIAGAKRQYYRLLPVALALGGEENWAAKVKEMVRLEGLPAGKPRKPFIPLHPEKSNQMRDALKSAGLV
jgi:4-hydroxy-tetrahydrodipicolinate synthase